MDNFYSWEEWSSWQEFLAWLSVEENFFQWADWMDSSDDAWMDFEYWLIEADWPDLPAWEVVWSDIDAVSPGFSTAPAVESNAVFTLYDSEANTPAFLLEQMTGDITGIAIDEESLRYIGADVAASYFSEVDFGANARLGSSGILLTSGSGAPPLENTELDYSVPHFAPGDSELDALAQEAFSFAGATYDAAILEFSFTVTDPGVQSISFDLLFGSEEFPEFVDSDFVDIAAVIVNGQNYAYLDGDPDKPLSIVGATVDDGRFIDNTQGILPIEYNGMTPRLTVTVPLDGNTTTYDVRLAVADTGDDVLDSGLFISNFQTLGTGFGGTYVNVQAGDEGEELSAPSPNTATLFFGGAGNDTMTGSLAPDVYDLTKGGQNIVQGSLAQLDQDTLVGFSPDDVLKFLGTLFGIDDLTVTQGSAILDVDVSGDGEADSTVTLEGDFSNGEFAVVQEGDDTLITFEAALPAPDQDQLLIVDAQTPALLSIDEPGVTRVLGDTAGKQVQVGAESGAVNLAAGSEVDLTAFDLADLSLVRNGTTLEVFQASGAKVAQLAASTSADLTGTLLFQDGVTLSLTADLDQQALVVGDSLFAVNGDSLAGSTFLSGVAQDDALLVA